MAASMEPRYVNRGNQAGGTITRGGGIASMEPRYVNRGNIDLRIKSDERQIASMEPRYVNRGNIPTPTHSPLTVMLQWSRGM